MRTAWLLIALALPGLAATAADWPQYKGPQRNDVSAEKGLLRQWPAGGPPLLWTYTNVGVGYSGPAVVGDRLYTLGGRGDTEYLIALDIASIKDQTVAEAWATPIGPLFQWEGNNWSAGPSSTPTVDGDQIFALGGMGGLICVEADSGKLRWRKNLPEELGAEVNPVGGGPKKLGWGFTCSPLVDGDRLVCLPGGPLGTVAALNKRTGKVLWRSRDVTVQTCYTSPMIAEVGGLRQYVALTNQGVFGVDARSGRVLWSYARTPPYSTEVINSPLIQGPLVYITVGGGQGCDLLRIEHKGGKFNAAQVYSNKDMTNHHGNVVLVDGHVYGFSQNKGWVCQSLATGATVWTERGNLGAGALTYADGHLYCYGEDEGEVVLIEASKSGWNESGRFRIPRQTTFRKPNGKIWTPPVLSNAKLFLRDQDLLFCYDIKGKD